MLAALGLAAVMLYAPGLVLLRGWMRMAWPQAVMLAPAPSVGFAALVALTPAQLGGFTPMTWMLGMAAVAAIPSVRYLLSGLSRGPGAPAGEQEARADRWNPTLIAIIVATAVIAAWMWLPLIWPLSAIPQHYDLNWHAYVAAVIQNTHIGAPWLLVPLDPLLPELRHPYPTGMHNIMALAATGSPSTAPAVNAVQFLFTAAVAPMGVAALGAHLLPRRWHVAIAAGALAMVAPGFAGTILAIPSYAAGLAIVPGAIVLILRAARSGGSWSKYLVAACAVVGVFATHPAAAICAVVPLTAAAAEHQIRRSRSSWRWVACPTALAATLGAIWLSNLIAGEHMASARPPYTDLAGAITDIAVGAWTRQHSTSVNVLIVATIAGWAGLFWLGAKAHTWWPLVTAAVFAVLFAIAAGTRGSLRLGLTGPWFSDWYRLQPMVVMMLSIGIAAAAAAGTQMARQPGAVRAKLPVLAWVSVAGLIWFNVQAPASRGYAANSRRPTLVTPAELEAFAWLSQHVRAGERVLNDWTEGTEWMYATHAVVPFQPYAYTSWASPERDRLLSDFARLGKDPSVAVRLRQYRIRYVIVSSSRLEANGHLTLPRGNRGLTKVFVSADTTIYLIDTTNRTTTCSSAETPWLTSETPWLTSNEHGCRT